MKRSAIFLCAAAAATLPWFSTSVQACTINESMQTHVPFNAVTLSNADRVSIADKVLRARMWPEVDIQATIVAGAYVREQNIERLKHDRGALVKAYLIQLGIKPENVIVDHKTFTEQMVSNVDGRPVVRQIDIELVPLCNGDCSRLCDDPRVTPRSRLVQ